MTLINKIREYVQNVSAYPEHTDTIEVKEFLGFLKSLEQEKAMSKKIDKLKKMLDSKYESYIVIGQKEEFKETELYLNAYSLGILSLMNGAMAQYKPLKDLIQGYSGKVPTLSPETIEVIRRLIIAKLKEYPLQDVKQAQQEFELVYRGGE